MSNDSNRRPLDEILNKAEKREVLAALKRTGGNRSQAAKDLGISRTTFYRRMNSFGISGKKNRMR